MFKRTTLPVLAGLLAAALVPGGCRDSASPERRGPLAPQFDAAAAPDVALDQATGLVGTSGTALWQGFSPTNPHKGDAIVATFFWRGSTNIITSVTDRLGDGTPVGNTYTLVEYIQAGGMSMATYVATNVQNFPDPNADWNDQLEVHAHLSAAVTDGGVVLSAYTGVNAVSAAALGAHRSAIGSGSSETTARPGAISVNARALVYGVTVSNDGVAGLAQPPGFATTIMVSDAEMSAEGDYAVPMSAGSVDPQWTWFFNAPSTPRTWLATVLALNSAAAPQPAVATRLAFTVQPSGTTAGTTIAPAVKVAALDDAGNTVAGFGDTIRLALGNNPGGGTLSGTKAVKAVGGVATFSNLSIDKVGNGYTLVATATGLTGATSTAFDIAPRTEVRTAAAAGIALDQQNGSLGVLNSTMIFKGFNPTNPRLGSTVIATFYWLGSTNIIPTVLDRLADGTPVGNLYHLVANISDDNIAMATFVATNVQNFPEGTFPDGQKILVVQATFSANIADGGVLISSYTGVDPVFEQAFAGFARASGSGSAPTIAHPGPIGVSAGALAYATTMANVVVGLNQPADFTPLNGGPMSNTVIKTDGVFSVRASAGFVDPQWTWSFDQAPGTWLASAIALNPAPPPPATHLVFTVQPTNTTAGATISPAVQVAAQDDAGNTVTGFTGTITVALGANPGGGTLSGTTSVAAVNGVATFSTLSINNPGNGYTLVATTTGLTGATSAPFNITPRPATHLVFTVQPTNTTAGSTISPAVRVAAQDDAGVTVTSFTGTITVALGANPGGGTLSGTTSVAAVNGVATFSTLSINNPGNGYTLVATTTGLTGATSAPFNITPRLATHLVFTVQPTNTTAGSTISPAVRVAAQDDAGVTVTSFTGSITIALGTNPAGGTLSGTKIVTAVNGVATFSNLSIDKAGNNYTLVATTTAPGVTGATSAPFNIAAAPQQVQVKTSGGGRIDPAIGKTTFGFNVDGRSGSSFQGETEVVYHGGTSQMTRIHSSSIDGMTTSSDPRGGVCVTWTGSARVDNGAQRRFTATACDNGQPNGGAGPDRFGITVDGAISIGLTDLKGGNTQARQ